MKSKQYFSETVLVHVCSSQFNNRQVISIWVTMVTKYANDSTAWGNEVNSRALINFTSLLCTNMYWTIAMYSISMKVFGMSTRTHLDVVDDAEVHGLNFYPVCKAWHLHSRGILAGFRILLLHSWDFICDFKTAPGFYYQFVVRHLALDPNHSCSTLEVLTTPALKIRVKYLLLGLEIPLLLL